MVSAILDLLLTLQELVAQRHLHEQVLGDDAHTFLVGVAEVRGEVVLGRHFMVEAEEVPGVDDVLMWDAGVVCDLVNGALEVESAIQRGHGEGWEEGVVLVGDNIFTLVDGLTCVNGDDEEDHWLGRQFLNLLDLV